MTERPAPTIKGPWIVLATLSLFVLVPLFVTGVWLLTGGDGEPPPAETDRLVWAERESWPRSMQTTFKSLERGMMSAARTNEVYKDYGFHLDPEHAAAIARCAELARDDAAFQSAATRDALKRELDQLPDLFYAHYLLGVWHDWQGDTDAAEQAFSAAFDHAPAALIQRYVTADGSPGAASIPLAFAADQVVNDALDRSVVLVYPAVRTDDAGFVYLPVYKTILREADPYADTSLPPAAQQPGWFTFYGRVGRLDDVTLP